MDRRTAHTTLREKYRRIHKSIEINNDQSEIQSAIIDIRREISNFNSQLRDLSSAHRKLTQTTVIILTGILMKIENHQRRGEGARSNTVVSQSIQSNEAKIQWVEQENVFNNRMSTAAIININHKDVATFLDGAKGFLIQKVNAHLQQKNSLKINTVLAANFEMIKDDVIQTVTTYFSDGSMTILQSTDLDSQLSENFEILKTDSKNMEDKGSGWTLSEIIHLEVQINEYIPLQGGNSSYIDLPQWIINTRSVVNIQNSDNMCFIWSVLAGLYNVKEHANRVSTYQPYLKNLNLAGLNFPLSWKQISQFEKMNNLKVNIYGIESDLNIDDENSESDHNQKKKRFKRRSKRIVPFYISKNESEKNTIPC